MRTSLTEELFWNLRILSFARPPACPFLRPLLPMPTLRNAPLNPSRARGGCSGTSSESTLVLVLGVWRLTQPIAEGAGAWNEMQSVAPPPATRQHTTQRNRMPVVPNNMPSLPLHFLAKSLTFPPQLSHVLIFSPPFLPSPLPPALLRRAPCHHFRGGRGRGDGLRAHPSVVGSSQPQKEQQATASLSSLPAEQYLRFVHF